MPSSLPTVSPIPSPNPKTSNTHLLLSLSKHSTPTPSSLHDLIRARRFHPAAIHALAVKANIIYSLPIRTALLSLYSCHSLPHLARRLFDQSPRRDLLLLNTMLAAHVKSGEYHLAQRLFCEMPLRNTSTYNTILDMHSNKMGDMAAAHRMFEEMPDRDIISYNIMLSGLCREGDCNAAREMFDSMPQRDLVSWNLVINCYVRNQMFTEALQLFSVMQRDSVRADGVTMVAVLPACAHLAALDLGRWFHEYIRRRRITMDVFVTTALVDMYGRCGSIPDAWRVFESSKQKDAFLCATMIEVFAMHGRAKEAFEVFDWMQRKRVNPNDVTFVGILKVCVHVGLVEAGFAYFNMMQKEFGMAPKVEHFGCMVDLLSRAGRLEEARQLISNMPMNPPPVVWASLLSACRIHGDVDLAEEAAHRLIELEPESCANYVLLSNIYSKANRWEDAAKIRKLMKERGVAKKPGCSSIELNNEVHEFLAGDREHPHGEEIYNMLDQMVVRLKTEGYLVSTDTALHDVDRDGKEQSLIHHSEKLALAFGLITTDERSQAIRIVKNLRVCKDCHLFLKLASKVYGRQVIVRDCHRFHHFSDGSCSCADYW